MNPTNKRIQASFYLYTSLCSSVNANTKYELVTKLFQAQLNQDAARYAAKKNFEWIPRLNEITRVIETRNQKSQKFKPQTP